MHLRKYVQRQRNKRYLTIRLISFSFSRSAAAAADGLKPLIKTSGLSHLKCERNDALTKSFENASYLLPAEGEKNYNDVFEKQIYSFMRDTRVKIYKVQKPNTLPRVTMKKGNLGTVPWL